MMGAESTAAGSRRGLILGDIDVAVTEWWEPRPGFDATIWRGGEPWP